MTVINRDKAERDGAMEEINARKDEIINYIRQRLEEPDEFEDELELVRDTVPGLREYDKLNLEILMAEEEGRDTTDMVRRQQEILKQSPEAAAYVRWQSESLRNLLGDL